VFVPRPVIKPEESSESDGRIITEIPQTAIYVVQRLYKVLSASVVKSIPVITLASTSNRFIRIWLWRCSFQIRYNQKERGHPAGGQFLWTELYCMIMNIYVNYSFK